MIILHSSKFCTALLNLQLFAECWRDDFRFTLPASVDRE
jgi:hypothetical protein